jgi:hypothetical protein
MFEIAIYLRKIIQKLNIKKILRSSLSISSITFFEKTGIIFHIYISDGLQHPNTYKDTLEKHENYNHALASFSRLHLSPTVGTVSLKPTILPTKKHGF